jgi:hypothetical protein
MTQNCTTIGTNSRTYLLTGADTGNYISATVTATDQEGQSTSSTSQAVGPIS